LLKKRTLWSTTAFVSPGHKAERAERLKQEDQANPAGSLADPVRERLPAVVERQMLPLPASFELSAEIDAHIGPAEFELGRFAR